MNEVRDELILCPCALQVVLDSDWPEFGGHYRNDRHAVYHAKDENWCSRPHYLEVYSPSRTVMVFARAK